MNIPYDALVKKIGKNREKSGEIGKNGDLSFWGTCEWWCEGENG